MKNAHKSVNNSKQTNKWMRVMAEREEKQQQQQHKRFAMNK